MTNSSHVSFVFRGFPALHLWRRLLAVPLCGVYAAVLAGNGALVLVVRGVPSLRRPPYLLLSALCAVDVLVASAIVPNVLLALLVDRDRISLAGCLAQMFCTHFLSSVESTLLLAMALDRYAAVCQPLHYERLTGRRAWPALLLFTLARSGGVMAALVALAATLRFCESRVIRHIYCDHMALVSLACGDTRRSAAAGVAVIACFVGVDIPLILLSYVQILRVALRAAPGGEERLKALHTCATHLMVVLVFYLVGSVAFLSHNLRLAIPPDLHTSLGLAYILLPAAANPLIYGARTADIRRGFATIFRRLRPAGGSAST